MKPRYFSYLLPLTATGFAEVSLPRSEAALEIRAEDAAVRRQRTLAELERVLGPKEWKALANGPRSTFFREMQGPLLEELMFSGPLPEDPAKVLRNAEALWKEDRSGMADRNELTTAAAVALTYARKDWPEDQADERYRCFRDSREAGKLHPVFRAGSSRCARARRSWIRSAARNRRSNGLSTSARNAAT